MNKTNKSLLVSAGIAVIAAFAFSIFSLTQLGNIGDGNPILTPLRILSRDVLAVAFAVFLVIIYLWRKDK